MNAELDPLGPLPSGFLAVEASAGTGKTHTITTLVARFVAEAGVPAAALCVVTFTEAATAELRGRIRERLARLVRELDAGAGDDELVAHLLDADPDEVARRVDRLRAAVTALDDATIATIHGFCARVLASSPGGASSATLLVDDHDVDEVVNDELLALLDGDPDTPVEHPRLAAAVRSALQLPNAALWPGDDVVGSTAPQRRQVESMRVAVELVERCVAEVRRRRRARRQRSFDDLVGAVAAMLTGPDGPTIVGQLRQRFRVVLIDEFQDTDTVQWDLFRRAFVDQPDPVITVVVGDPKQAIYRFRSAELSAYLGARATADEVASLEVNWRSDGPVLDGLEHVLGRVDFGGGVGFRAVRPAPGRDDSRLVGVGGPAVQLRCVPGELPVPVARRRVRADLVGVVHHLLREARLVDRHGVEHPLRPRDIAILTRANSDAARAAADLGAAGVPAATASGNSVLASAAADQWRYLLRGLVHPASPGPARAAALSWFVGRRPDELDDDATVMGEVHDLLAAWALALSAGGVPVVLRQARDRGLVERILRRPTGARDLTDLEHVGELLLRLGGGRPLAPSAALALLDEIQEARDDEDVARDLLARRVDLDDDAVTVLTVHGAKGREFPVVLCPYLWTQLPAERGMRHAELGGVRRIDVAPVVGVSDGKLREGLKAAAESEVQAEARRLVYVALTRAQHRLVAWWAPVSRWSPLTDVLGSALGQHGDTATGEVA
nr:UvrD-helicase domain-containing protein [Ilumatobacteraceae bacterium]